MNQKIKVSVLGATGMVGQNYIRLLDNHPWFQIVDVAASPRSAGNNYSDAVGQNWLMPGAIPASVHHLIVRDVRDFDTIPKNVECVFSAMDLPKKEETRDLEFEYAKAGFPIISNSSANRWTNDVPMIIPEINPDHADIIPIQQSGRGLPANGFVAVKPNCSIQSFLVALHALEEAGFPVGQVQVTTLQALSGGGQATIASSEMEENVIPYISGEEEKTENEPLKILGQITNDGIENTDRINISATCTRVPVIDGHMAVVYIRFKDKKISIDAIKSIWSEYKGLPQFENLPTGPERPIIYIDEENRPQPKLDRGLENGMAVTIGRLAQDKFFDFRFVALSHNTVRGAAGGAILMAELLVKKGYIHA